MSRVTVWIILITVVGGCVFTDTSQAVHVMNGCSQPITVEWFEGGEGIVIDTAEAFHRFQILDLGEVAAPLVVEPNEAMTVGGIYDSANGVYLLLIDGRVSAIGAQQLKDLDWVRLISGSMCPAVEG